jgi:hypothetical protein
MRLLAFAAAIGTAVMMWGGSADALQVLPDQAVVAGSDLLLVRDGCGRGFRYSYRRQRCVPDYDVEFRRVPSPIPPPVYYRPPPRVVVPVCPPGQRYSNSRGICVWR